MARDEEISGGVPSRVLSAQVLKLFKEMGKDRLDLNVCSKPPAIDPRNANGYWMRLRALLAKAWWK